MKRTLLLAALVLAPIARAESPAVSAEALSEIPVEFQEAFAGDRSLSLNVFQLASIQDGLQNFVAKTSLAAEYKDDVVFQVMAIVEAANQGDVSGAWQAVQDLRALGREIRAQWDSVEDRGFFGLIEGGVDLIKAVQAKDINAILKAAVKLLWEYIF